MLQGTCRQLFLPQLLWPSFPNPLLTAQPSLWSTPTSDSSKFPLLTHFWKKRSGKKIRQERFNWNKLYCFSTGSFAFVWVSWYRLVPSHVFRDPGFLNARASQRLPEHQGRNHGQQLRSFLCAPRWLHVPRFTFATYLTMNAPLERTFQNKCSNIKSLGTSECEQDYIQLDSLVILSTT